MATAAGTAICPTSNKAPMGLVECDTAGVGASLQCPYGSWRMDVPGNQNHYFWVKPVGHYRGSIEIYVPSTGTFNINLRCGHCLGVPPTSGHCLV